MQIIKEIFNPYNIEKNIRYFLPYLLPLSLITLSIGLIWGYFFTPPDYLQGNLVRIMFVHVPAAFAMSIIYYLICFLAVNFLVFNLPISWILVKIFAKIGLIFTIITLISGSLWGKPSWGSFWEFDLRLLSVAIQFIIYIGLIIVINVIDNTNAAKRMVAYYCIITAVNLPVIKFSVNFWNSIHQQPSLTLFKAPTISGYFLWPLLISIVGTLLFSLLLACLDLQRELQLLKNLRSSKVKSKLMKVN